MAKMQLKAHAQHAVQPFSGLVEDKILRIGKNKILNREI